MLTSGRPSWPTGWQLTATKPMHPPDCPQNWQYKDSPGYPGSLEAAARGLLVALRGNRLDTEVCARDSRPIHEDLFRDLAPKDHPYFAGHYRGEPFRCLRYYTSGIPSDARVGADPRLVTDSMGRLSAQIGATLRGLDAAWAASYSVLSPEDKLLYAVTAACSIFVEFLTVHPYADGNGHAARFCLIAVLGRYGYWLRNFPLEPRPPDPPYSDAIKFHRDGRPEILESIVLRCVVK